MSQRPTVVINFKDVPHDEGLRSALEQSCEHLADTFHEITHIEITFTAESDDVAAHGHVTGKHRDLGAHAQASEARPAADRMLDKLERQLRTLHDKRIFSQRRDAQRDPPKKRSAS